MASSRMGLRHIEAFRAVMMTGSMTAAARSVHTSQPHISRLIAQLEAITQFALFDRNGSRLTPTLDGARFYQEVEKTFVGLAGLESAAAGIRSFSASRLSVAAMPRLAGGLLARIVARFKTEYPDVMVSIHSGNASTVHNWISSGFCDMGLAMLSGDAPGIQVEPVMAMNCVAIMPRGHRLARLDRIKPADFAGEPFVAFTSSTPLRDRIDRVFTQAKVERQVVAEAGLGASISAMVGAGLGVSLINPLAAREEYATHGVELRPFTPAVPVTVALLFPPAHTRSRLVTVFARYARELMLEEMADLRARPTPARRASPRTPG
ncbi:LysR substrate-binding domain-containing protein [Bordetella genomosp. 1]|uniref:Transcriptional regulator n=1 Tax=Bordetella genomosp. 1 TaxID=1395607 RepID=A0ABX4EXA0_9BORD|nr:LysR substrate-binding domain-containing protein [Bordetella genomosp. 1]OZI58767.1 transcriptional regulator [Bordetella genomosp. 1]